MLSRPDDEDSGFVVEVLSLRSVSQAIRRLCRDCAHLNDLVQLLDGIAACGVSEGATTSILTTTSPVPIGGVGTSSRPGVPLVVCAGWVCLGRNCGGGDPWGMARLLMHYGWRMSPVGGYV